MAKITSDILYLGEGGIAFNYNHYTKEEVVNDGDWEEIMGYEDGSMQLFLECEPNDKGAFKCWVIGG